MRLALRRPAVRLVRPRSRRHLAGFTLLELMVVVAIIGITAAIAAPEIGRALAVSRADRATHDIVRLGRRGRAEAIGYGRAYLMRLVGGGLVQLWRGRTSLCRGQDWAAITGAGTCSAGSAADGNCVDFVDAATYNAAPHSVLFAQAAAPVVEMCFQPSGDMLVRNAGTTGAFATPATGFVTITLARQEGGSTVDPLRGAVFPASGAPRTLR